MLYRSDYGGVALAGENKAGALAGIILFAALTAIGSQIRLPLQPVPFTMQVFFVLLSGIVLGPYLGASSQLAFITMGLAGAPVFAAAPHYGPAVLFGPTGGYLWGFVLASYAAGRLAGKGHRAIVSGLVGLAAVYLCGFAGLALHLSSAGAAWQAGITPFLPGDLVKVIALECALPGWRMFAPSRFWGS